MQYVPSHYLTTPFNVTQLIQNHAPSQISNSAAFVIEVMMFDTFQTTFVCVATMLQQQELETQCLILETWLP
jgi:hypothetical protein